MVLSNKKLKQRLRTLLADSLSAAESNTHPSADAPGAGDVNQQLQAVRDLLSSKSQKPKTTKKPKRQKTQPSPAAAAAEEETVDRKRKRDDDGDGGKDEEGDEVEKWNRKKEKLEKFKLKRKKLKKMKQKLKEKKETVQKDKPEETVEKAAVAAAKEIDDSELDPKKIYVGGIPYYSTEDDIRSFFEGCGTVTEVDCIMFPETGKFRGIAMLSFKTDAAAKRALALDGADMGGFYLKIQPYKASRAEKSDFAPEIVEGYNRIYIGNLSWDVTEDDLKKLFSECKVSSIRFGMDKETGEFKGYAHVDFSDSASLEAALKLDQCEVCERPVKIRCAVPAKAVVKKAKVVDPDGKPKKKRRVECFICGVWGHLASACNRKPTIEVGGSEAVDASLNSKPTSNKSEGETITEKTKIKRRTCYECGVPGHLSIACPNKATVEATTVKKAEDDTSTGNTKKRQTCYECGVPGHISSACPQKGTVEAQKGTVEASETGFSSKPTATKVEDATRKTKKKRQTCYECGVPGHISSACPKKSAVEVGGSNGNS